MEYFPSKSDTTPVAVPFSITFTPAIGAPESSEMVPVTFCASEKLMPNMTSIIKQMCFMYIIFLD